MDVFYPLMKEFGQASVIAAVLVCFFKCITKIVITRMAIDRVPAKYRAKVLRALSKRGRPKRGRRGRLKHRRDEPPKGPG
jgi:hypothetical protein